ncbi:MAG: flagellar M-ring protein FliF [Lachnospiraceae bacterium]|nr:flagellar M-ring protein FliF [Lachnospiraceae bacterium]
MRSLKERWQKLADKTKKQLIAIVGGTIVIAAAILLILHFSRDNSYSILFTGLSQEEAQQVSGLLRDADVSYQYNENNGSISVPSSTVDQTRADLLSQGYPKSGFSYDMYIDHAGLMSTESDRKQYTLYDLQDRLGAQIRLFDGVQDAKVTITAAKESNYALSDETESEASAAVTVTMMNGQTLSAEGADAIRRLISTAVRGMTFTNISVFDAGTMMEVGSSGGSSSTIGAASDLNELTELIENKIAANIRTILEKIYGKGKVEVAVKGTVNMSRLLRESTTYSTPEKIDEEDKTGLKNWESASGAREGASDPEDGGVAGADGNAEVPRYTYENGDDTADNYSYDSVSREWLYNVVKEQTEVDPGVLENTTISVVIDTDDMSVSLSDLRSLVANASGISSENAENNITIVRTLSAESRAENSGGDSVPALQPDQETEGLPLPLLIALIAAGVLILLLLLLLLLRKKRKKKREADEIASALSPGELGVAHGNWTEDEFPDSGEDGAMQLEEDEEMSQNEEILKLKMQRNLKLKQNIGEIVDQNPQIVAKLVQGWLGEEGDRNGGSRSADKQKHK